MTITLLDIIFLLLYLKLFLKVLKLKVCVFKSKYLLIQLYKVLICTLKVVSIYSIIFLPKILSFLSLKSNRKYFKFNGRDMEILFAKYEISHGKNLLKTESKIKKVLNQEYILNGIQLYLFDPLIKLRCDEDNIKKYIYNTMYM